MVRITASVLLGLYICFIATIVYQHRIGIGPIELPWGTALGVGTTYLVALALGQWFAAAPAAVALGWGVGLILPMAWPTASFLIARDAWGWAFVLASVGALVAAYIQANTRNPATPSPAHDAGS